MTETTEPIGPKVDADLETTLLALIREGKKMEAIKNLRASTGCGLREASAWVMFHPALNAARPETPCPYFGKGLRSGQARQCFTCGMDWHDPIRVVNRRSQPRHVDTERSHERV